MSSGDLRRVRLEPIVILLKVTGDLTDDRFPLRRLRYCSEGDRYSTEPFPKTHFHYKYSPDLSKPVEIRPIIECPSELGQLARAEWDRIVPLLAADDRLSQLDRGLLAIYCNAYAAYLEATTALQEYGQVMKSPSGYPIQSPYVSIMSKNAELMIRIGTEFGFSPASRVRLPNNSKDPFLLNIPDIREIASDLKPLE
jgi:P27 family predicted phage terminase small subunit